MKVSNHLSKNLAFSTLWSSAYWNRISSEFSDGLFGLMSVYLTFTDVWGGPMRAVGNSLTGGHRHLLPNLCIWVQTSTLRGDLQSRKSRIRTVQLMGTYKLIWLAFQLSQTFDTSTKKKQCRNKNACEVSIIQIRLLQCGSLYLNRFKCDKCVTSKIETYTTLSIMSLIFLLIHIWCFILSRVTIILIHRLLSELKRILKNQGSKKNCILKTERIVKLKSGTHMFFNYPVKPLTLFYLAMTTYQVTF